VLPADDEVAAVWLVIEVPAPELELDPHALEPSTPTADAPFCLAIGIARLDAFDHEAEVVGDHAEQEDDSLLVDRRVLPTVETFFDPAMGGSARSTLSGCRAA